MLRRWWEYIKAWFRGASDRAMDPEVEINMSLEHMLMEAARIEDELKNLAKRAPLPTPGDAVALVKPCPVRWKELEPEDLDLVQDLVEHGDWWALLDSTATDDLTLTRRIVGLRKKGIVSYGE